MLTNDNQLPEDGTQVKAMTYGSIEYDREPEELTGTLTTHPSPFGVPQCWVNGVQVNPDTVVSAEDDGEYEEVDLYD